MEYVNSLVQENDTLTQGHRPTEMYNINPPFLTSHADSFQYYE